MKYKVGDKVTLTNGDIMTVDQINDKFKWYFMREDPLNCYTDEMIECKVEEETTDCEKCGLTDNSIKCLFMDNCSHNKQKTIIEITEDGLLDEYEELTDRAFKGGYEKCKSDIELNGFQLPYGYIFKDENGNVINATKIVLEKKKKEYPKTYEECREIIKLGKEHTLEGEIIRINNYKITLLESFQKLLICRDAYWKVYGEENGLEKPWEPDWTNQELLKHCIANIEGQIKTSERYVVNTILAFPTEEMRDAFYEAFKKEIEICKELL